MQILSEHPWLLAVGIFVARVADVSLGTLRTILVFRAHRFLAAAIGFLEIVIWVAAASQVLRNLDAWYLVVAYAGGFATGNIVGIWLESKLALGTELVRAVSDSPDVQLADRLRASGYSVTEVKGRGDGGAPVEVLFIVEQRRRVRQLLQVIHDHDPAAFCTLSDVKHAHNAIPRVPQSRFPGGFRSIAKRK